MNNSLVSVIMPAYNAEKTIKYSIDSVFAQTYQNWELLIIDDGSSDRTLQISEEYSHLDSRVRVLNTESNQGVASARNTGINSSSGRYLAFLDSDDIWYIDKLSTQINYMMSNKTHMSFTSYEVISEDGSLQNKCVRVPETISYRKLLKGSRIGCLTVILDKLLIKDIKFENVGHEDYVLWLNILKAYGPAVGIPITLAQYRVFDSSLSSNKSRAISWQWNIYRNKENLSLIKSVYLMINYAVNSVIKYR